MAAESFQNDDEEAQFCLTVLRDGTDAAKLVARERLAAIFARREMFEEAAELYERNLQAGARSPELLERLSETYRQLGDVASAEAALAEAGRQHTSTAPAAPPAASTPQVPVTAATLPPAPPPSASTPPRSASPTPSSVTTAASDPTADTPGVSLAARPTEAAAAIGNDPASPFGVPVGGTGQEAAATERSPNGEVEIAPSATPVPATAATAKLPTHHDRPEMSARPDAASAPSRRDGRSATGPLMAAGILLFAIVVPIVLLALLVVNPIALYLEGRAAGPIVDVEVGEPAPLKIAPGAAVAWYLQTGRSVSGLWATPGLELALDQEIAGADQQFIVTAARPQSWGETITIVERQGQGRAHQVTIVPATFETPDELPPAGTVLDGQIVGQVIVPRLTETSEFNTISEEIRLPVQLVVVSGPELWLDRFVNAVRMFFDEDRWLLVTIGALLGWCILAGGAAIVFRSRPT
jgi:hypothetical protein